MNIIEIYNTIRDNASQEFRERVPEGTRYNIQAIAEVMTNPNDAVVVNEFMSTLLNKIVKTHIISKMFENPLKSLKKGNKPLGDTIEQIYTNFIKANKYDQTGAGLLNRNLPDTKSVYFRMNRQDEYPITVNYEELQKAFLSWNNLDSYVASIIRSVYNSAELDEFVLMKQLFKIAYENNAIKVVEVPDPLLGKTEAETFIKTVKTVSGDMEFPNSNNNAYLEAQNTDDKPIITFSKKREQVLFIDNATNVGVNIDVLANTFNMSVSDFNETRKIIIDSFPDPSIRAALVDEQFFQVFDDLFYFTEWRNPKGLYTNYYLHVWQTLCYSVLVNSVLFRVASDEDQDDTVETFSVTKNLVTGVKATNRRISATEGSSYSTGLTGVTNQVVSVTMGGNDITDSVYNALTKSIQIPIVTGDIVITVRNLNSYTITNTLSVGITNSNNANSIMENESYNGTLSGITSETVAVTMGGETITNTVYDETTNKIEIEKVTGNIVITVS